LFQFSTNNGSGAMFGSVINITIISFVLVSVYPTSKILTWFLVGISLNIVRYFFHKIYFQNISCFSIHTWLLISRTFTSLSGLVYGLLPIFFFYANNHLYQILVILLQTGMAAATVGKHATDLLAYCLFVFLAITPLVTRLFLNRLKLT
jgi:hypothetical protein